MFEAIQLLTRLQEHFGEDSIVSIARGSFGLIIFTVTWNGDDTFLSQWAIPSAIIQSVISNSLMEQLLIQNIENDHKLWEVGEI